MRDLRLSVERTATISDYATSSAMCGSGLLTGTIGNITKWRLTMIRLDRWKASTVFCGMWFDEPILFLTCSYRTG